MKSHTTTHTAFANENFSTTIVPFNIDALCFPLNYKNKNYKAK
jgi:hypothetical protein